MVNIVLPTGACKILAALEAAGYEAYVVGGCVRDSLLGVQPKDWDICTDAKPKDVKAVFANAGKKFVETGIKHGTVTVLEDDGAYEVTTFRTEGEYTDHRHPDKVEFISELQADLARRDFTINAMAYSPTAGFHDPFGGEKDLESKTLRCVGNPCDRIREDWLRIMRALRFSAVYGFTIDPETLKAIYEWRYIGLRGTSAERIRDELCKLLLGRDAAKVLLEHKDIVKVILPEVILSIGFQQNSPYHVYDVYEHTCHAIEGYKGDDIVVKLALLFHDLGKPFCYTEDERGGHFKGHPKFSAEMAKVIMTDYRFDNKTKFEVCQLVENHDAEFAPTPKAVRRLLAKLGEEQLDRLIQLRYADIYAHNPETQQPLLDKAAKFEEILRQVLSEEHCFSLKDLNIDGYDIMNLGLTEGKEVGDILKWLFSEVLDGNIPNIYHDLMVAAEHKINGSFA